MILIFSLQAETIESQSQVDITKQDISLQPGKRNNAVYLELGGQGGIFTINYERLINDYAIRVGGFAILFASAFTGDINHLWGNKHKFELGTGFIIEQSNLSGAFVSLNIGYRYQANNGFLFRLGFTPLYGISRSLDSEYQKLHPNVGISLGYSF